MLHIYYIHKVKSYLLQRTSIVVCFAGFLLQSLVQQVNYCFTWSTCSLYVDQYTSGFFVFPDI